MRGVFGLLSPAVMWVFVAAAFAAGEPCGILNPPGQYGPYDYWADQDKLGIVEEFHFTKEIARMDPAVTDIGNQLDYVLRAFPNHPYALGNTMKLRERSGSEKIPGMNFSVACYLERAIRFRPKDRTVRVIYAEYLGKTGKKAEAINQLLAVQLPGKADNSYLHYEIGLLYFDLGDFEKSLDYAQRAYRQGATLSGLKNKLVRAGKWRDAPAETTESARPGEPGVRKKPSAAGTRSE